MPRFLLLASGARLLEGSVLKYFHDFMTEGCSLICNGMIPFTIHGPWRCIHVCLYIYTVNICIFILYRTVTTNKTSTVDLHAYSAHVCRVSF